MNFKVYARCGNNTYGATIFVGDVVYNATESKYGESIAFVKSFGDSKWRTTEWFTVPNEIKDALFSKAVARSVICTQKD